MVEKEEKDNKETNKPDSSSDPTCAICEGQGCECAQSENNEKNINKEEGLNSEENNNSEENKLEEEIEKLKEEKIRLLAEMENLRKRFEREKVETIKFGSINLARDILSPADNLERALSALPEKEEYSQNIKNLVEGLKMVLKEFKNIKIPKCIRYNEMYDIEWTRKEIDESGATMIVCHHENDMQPYIDHYGDTVKFYHIAHCAESSIFKQYPIEKQYDVLLVGALGYMSKLGRHYPLRDRMASFL